MNPNDLEAILRVALAFLLGGVIGFERESINQPAGLRTHMLVAGGSACFTIASIFGFVGPNVDPGRVAAQIVTGIGFLGAGAIWRTPNTVRGLTTAASIWMVAAIGMVSASGLYAIAIFCTVISAVALHFLRSPAKRRQLRTVGEPSLVPDVRRDGDEDADDDEDELPQATLKRR